MRGRDCDSPRGEVASWPAGAARGERQRISIEIAKAGAAENRFGMILEMVEVRGVEPLCPEPLCAASTGVAS